VAETPLTFEVFQQVRENPSPGAVFTPASEAAVDGFPRAIALGNVTPRGAGVEAPQNAIEEAMRILPGPATTVLVRRVREKRGDAFPMPLREFMATWHGWPPEEPPLFAKDAHG
jgi:hypothetical protein